MSKTKKRRLLMLDDLLDDIAAVLKKYSGTDWEIMDVDFDDSGAVFTVSAGNIKDSED
jgi:septum formation topological specificity factor MinE